MEKLLLKLFLGRLGHAEQKDEMVPRLIKFFDSSNRGVRRVFCGSSFTLVSKRLTKLCSR